MFTFAIGWYLKTSINNNFENYNIKDIEIQNIGYFYNIKIKSDLEKKGPEYTEKILSILR